MSLLCVCDLRVVVQHLASVICVLPGVLPCVLVMLLPPAFLIFCRFSCVYVICTCMSCKLHDMVLVGMHYVIVACIHDAKWCCVECAFMMCSGWVSFAMLDHFPLNLCTLNL
jgi:hypothetical protein